MKYISYAVYSHPKTMNVRWNFGLHAFGNPFTFNVTLMSNFAGYKSALKRNGRSFEIWVDIFGFGFMFWVII